MPEPADGLMPKGLEPGAGIEGLKGPEDYPNSRRRDALRAGWSDADVAAVGSGNLLGFLRRALPCGLGGPTAPRRRRRAAWRR